MSLQQMSSGYPDFQFVRDLPKKESSLVIIFRAFVQSLITVAGPCWNHTSFPCELKFKEVLLWGPEKIKFLL